MPTFCILTAIGLGGLTSVDAQVESKPGKASGNDSAETARRKPTESGPTKFLRVVRDDSGKPLAMQTAITRYRPDQGELVIDLIGAVHIGEGKYYRQLNDQFELYDAVLYELVAPQGTRVPAGGKKPSQGLASPLDLVSWMQGQAKSSLGLESQLEKVDYQKSNFIHADLSPTDMSRKMSERGDTPLTIGLSAITEIMRQQNKASDSAGKRDADGAAASQLSSGNFLEVLGDPLKMKLMMAEQFAQTGVMDTGLGATLNQLLIADRNEAAIKVLHQQIAGGKTKIAIFYGAAHMPDFEKRLMKELGLSQTKQVWVDAWDLTKAGNARTSSSTSKMLFELLNELGK
jgi:hypothetical protein